MGFLASLGTCTRLSSSPQPTSCAKFTFGRSRPASDCGLFARKVQGNECNCDLSPIEILESSGSSSPCSVWLSSHNVDEQRKQHGHAADVHQWGISARSLGLGSKKKPAHPNTPKNWNAREFDLCAPSVRNANIIGPNKKSAQSQEHACCDCRHAHNTRMRQIG
jgi:hypothetical protein